MTGVTTVDKISLPFKRGVSRIPCFAYKFGGLLDGMSICFWCGFHKCEHEGEGE